jgi:hypothetical protein
VIGEVFSVEIALDLRELNSSILRAQRVSSNTCTVVCGVLIRFRPTKYRQGMHWRKSLRYTLPQARGQK